MYIYTVQKKGETYASIAKILKVDPVKLKRDNNYKEIPVGTKIEVYSGPKPTSGKLNTTGTPAVTPSKTSNESEIKSGTVNNVAGANTLRKPTSSKDPSSFAKLERERLAKIKAEKKKAEAPPVEPIDIFIKDATKADHVLSGFNPDKPGFISEHRAVKVFDEFSSINKYGVLDGNESGYDKGWAYLFFTTPSLNIRSNSATGVQNYTTKESAQKDWAYIANVGRVENGVPFNAFMLGMAEKDPGLLDCLNNRLPKTPAIIPFLTNRFKSFDPKDTSLKTKNFGETPRGNRLMLPGSLIDSIGPDQFTVTFEETSNLDITKLHKVWTEYIYNVSIGEFYPNPEDVQNRVIDYLCSMYYMTLRPDGRTIEYFCKYTGVAPLNVNYSVFGHRRGDFAGNMEVSIPYMYNYKEDMTVDIIMDFNKSLGSRDRHAWVAQIVSSSNDFIRDPARHGRFDYWLEINDGPKSNLFIGSPRGQNYVGNMGMKL